jgi:hypothetical protein
MKAKQLKYWVIKNYCHFSNIPTQKYRRLKSNGNSHMLTQYVNQSESLYLDHFPTCQDGNCVSKESTCADNMKLYQTHLKQISNACHRSGKGHACVTTEWYLYHL